MLVYMQLSMIVKFSHPNECVTPLTSSKQISGSLTLLTLGDSHSDVHVMTSSLLYCDRSNVAPKPFHTCPRTSIHSKKSSYQQGSLPSDETSELHKLHTYGYEEVVPLITCHVDYRNFLHP